MLVSLPPRLQFVGMPLVWSRLLPISKDGFTQKLPNSRFGTGARATDKSSMTITPVMVPEPPETREQRIFTAPSGTASVPFRECRIRNGAPPSVAGRAARNEVGLADDTVAGVEELHG